MPEEKINEICVTIQNEMGEYDAMIAQIDKKTEELKNLKKIYTDKREQLETAVKCLKALKE